MSKFFLEKYSGPDSRHFCPLCGRHTLSYYINNEGMPFHPSVGRCECRRSCGYHYTPAQYVEEHRQELSGQLKIYRNIKLKYVPRMMARVSFIDQMKALPTLHKDSYLLEFLSSIVEDPFCVKDMANTYCLGATSDSDTIFWLVDYAGNIRTGKIVHLDRDSPKFVSKKDWIHLLWKGLEGVPKDFHLCKCFFGEHLLTAFLQKPVIVVESETVALVGYMLLPEFVWLATGDEEMLSLHNFEVLKGRKVTLMPTGKSFKTWTDFSHKLKFCRVSISDFLKDEVTPSDNVYEIINKILRFKKGGKAKKE